MSKCTTELTPQHRLLTAITADTTVGTKPEITLTVFQDTINVIAGQPLAGCERLPVGSIKAMQAALHGILSKIRDLNLELISVTRIKMR